MNTSGALCVCQLVYERERECGKGGEHQRQIDNSKWPKFSPLQQIIADVTGVCFYFHCFSLVCACIIQHCHNVYLFVNFSLRYVYHRTPVSTSFTQIRKHSRISRLSWMVCVCMLLVLLMMVALCSRCLRRLYITKQMVLIAYTTGTS